MNNNVDLNHPNHYPIRREANWVRLSNGVQAVRTLRMGTWQLTDGTSSSTHEIARYSVEVISRFNTWVSSVREVVGRDTHLFTFDVPKSETSGIGIGRRTETGWLLIGQDSTGAVHTIAQDVEVADLGNYIDISSIVPYEVNRNL